MESARFHFLEVGEAVVGREWIFFEGFQLEALVEEGGEDLFKAMLPEIFLVGEFGIGGGVGAFDDFLVGGALVEIGVFDA